MTTKYASTVTPSTGIDDGIKCTTRIMVDIIEVVNPSIAPFTNMD